MTSTPSVTRYRDEAAKIGRKRSEFYLTTEERAKVWEFIKLLRAEATPMPENLRKLIRRNV